MASENIDFFDPLLLMDPINLCMHFPMNGENQFCGTNEIEELKT